MGEKKLSDDILAAVSRAFEISKSATKRQNVRTKVTRKYNDFLEACPSLGEREGLERMICLALMVYCALCTNRIPTSVFNAPRMVLFNTLQHCEEQSWAERECILWMYMVTIDAWRDQGPEVKLLEELKLRYPATVRHWALVEKILRKFFWTSELSHYWKKHWEPKVLDHD